MFVTKKYAIERYKSVRHESDRFITIYIRHESDIYFDFEAMRSQIFFSFAFFFTLYIRLESYEVYISVTIDNVLYERGRSSSSFKGKVCEYFICISAYINSN
jgi:hypothetical protein